MRLPFPLKAKFDWWAIAGWLLMLAVILFYYSSLPPAIPRHFGGGGMPTAYSDKAFILVLPVIGLLLYVFLGWVASRPTPNRWSSVRPKPGKEEEVHLLTFRMTAYLRAAIMWSLAYITLATIMVALERWSGLGGGFTFLFILVMLAPCGYYTWKILELSD